MTFSHLCGQQVSGRLRILAVTALITFASVQTMAGQPPHAQSATSVILVHGAWADGSSWARVIPQLVEAGLNVEAVHLPLTSLAEDVAATQRAIARAKGSVLLIGHSYGGAVISEAGNDPKVVGLLFVAAFAPDKGESSLALATANPTPAADQIRPDKDGFLRLTPTGIFDDFAQDLSKVKKVVLNATQAPIAAVALGTPAQNPLSLVAITNHVGLVFQER